MFRLLEAIFRLNVKEYIYIYIYSEMFRLLEAIFRLNVKEYIYIYLQRNVSALRSHLQA